MPIQRPEYARIRLALESSTFFASGRPENLDVLAASAAVERYDKPAYIDSSAQREDKLWIVLEGALLVSLEFGNAEPVPIASLAPGSFYNSSVLVDGGTRMTQARAQPRTVLAAIAGRAFRDLARQDVEFSNCVSRLLLRRFQGALMFYADAIAAPLSERVARRLLGQALALKADPLRPEIELRATQTDLARMLGASRSKVNAELRRLEDIGVLRLGYRAIHIRDIQRLAQLVDGHVMAF